MSVDSAGSRDPRSRLVREKYFCVRPRPLEQWLWSEHIPASAERVFWLHWQEGMQRGDWCSELPIRRVARECQLDTSTVTRAYQLLTKLGCLRRSDPGRDAANPFQQATAITEIRLPHELLVQLDRYPTRGKTTESKTPDRQPTAPQTRVGEGTTTPAQSENPPLKSPDPFPGLTGRDRLRAISELTQSMSKPERHAYQEALRQHLPHMAFDPDSKLPTHTQTKILELLVSLAQPSSPPALPLTAPTPGTPKATARATTAVTTRTTTPRKLSLFELARLRRELQSATSTTTAPELLRQVVWSIESGALRRFDTRHALHIALKKIRQGQWTRPNRMPPNWARALSTPAAPESCAHA
jgi:hypothetical protein